MASIAFFFGSMRPQDSFTASIAASTIGCIFSAGALKPLTQNAKTELSQAGEQRVIYIRQALEGDQCAKQLVPAAAADSLREYADGLRAGAGGPDKR